MGSKPIDFLFKMVPCNFSLDLPLVGLGSSSMAVGPIYGSQPIGFVLFHWTLDLGPSCKVSDHCKRIEKLYI